MLHHIICAVKFQGYNGEKYKVDQVNELAKGRYVAKIILTLSDGTDVLVELFILERNDANIKWWIFQVKE